MKKNLLVIGMVGVIIVLGILIYYKYNSKLTACCVQEIEVASPVENQNIGPLVSLNGKALFSLSPLSYQIYENSGMLLAEGALNLKKESSSEIGLFENEIRISNPKSGKGRIEIFKVKSDTSVENKITIPVNFDPEQVQVVKVFFGRTDEMGGNSNDCSLVFPVERFIWKTNAPARAAIEELLSGPTPSEEQSEGYFTSLNKGVSIKGIKIEKNIASIEFDEQLEFQVGGSCRVSAIRSQIIQTLRQFENVKEVIISINGRTEDILQP